MPQRKKAKTKKQMRKSINSLWKALQEEKAKHAKASSMVGHMKQNFIQQGKIMSNMADTIREMGEDLIDARFAKRENTKSTANLIKELVKLDGI